MSRDLHSNDTDPADRDERVGQLADEMAGQLASGEPVDLEVYCQRYPELAADVPDVYESIRALQGYRPEYRRGDIGTGQPDASKHESLTRKRLGDFQILGEIGRGGMGVVYEAEQLSLGRTVALKVLPFAAVLDEKAIKRFKNEAKAAATLDHPHIVPIHAVGNERGVYYYAMSLINGLTLARVIDELQRHVVTNDDRALSIEEIVGEASRESSGHDLTGSTSGGLTGKPSSVNSGSLINVVQPGQEVDAHIETRPELPPSTSTRRSAVATGHFRNVARLGAQAAEALHYAHEHGIVHRDVKPGNLMVDGNGKLWVTDFGLARIETDAGLTMTGDLLGTLRYMAPEQLLVQRIVVDQRADVYSLGVTLYELLTLRPAFEESDRRALLKQIADDEPRRLRQVDGSIPRELETIVLKAMSKHPDGRYATAQELADDLERYLGGEPIKARPATAIESIRKWCGRHRAATTTIAVTVLAAVLVVSLSLRYAYVVGSLSNDLSDALKNAQTLRTEAEIARNEAVARGEELRREIYVQDVKSAYEFWHKGWIEEVHRLLGKQVPLAGELDQRGFEWSILRNLTWQAQPIELSGHNGPVNNVAVFAGGTRLASVGDDATIRIWDLETNEQEFVLRDARKIERLSNSASPSDLPGSHRPANTVVVSAAGNDYRAVAVSPDGKKLVTGNLVLSLWDLEKRCFLRDLAVFPTRIFSAAFSPDGKHVAAHSGDQAVQVISLEDGVLKRFQTDHGSYRLGFSPDGKVLAAPYKSPSGHGIRCWNTSTWDRIRDFGELERSMSTRGIAFSSDSNFLFAGTFGDNVYLLDIKRGASPSHTPRQRSAVTDVALSPNDQVLAVTHEDGSLVYWWLRSDWRSEPGNVFEGTPTLTPAHAGTARAVRFISNRRIATCGDDGLVRLWEFQERPNGKRVIDSELGQAVAFMPDGKEILVSTRNGISRYEATELRLDREVDIRGTRSDESPSRRNDSLTVSHDGRYAAIGSHYGEIVILDLSTNREVARIDQTDVRISSIDDIAFSLDGQWLASGSRDHTVRIWSTDDWRETRRINTKGWGSNVEFSPDGRYLIYSDSDGALELLEVSSWQSVARTQAHTGVKRGALCFTPDGRFVMSGHGDSIIRIWSAATLAEVGQLKGHTRDITHVAVHPNGTTIASTSHDRTLRLWHLPTRAEFGILDVGAGTGWDCCFSPDGSQLARISRSSSLNGAHECQIWDVSQGVAGE